MNILPDLTQTPIDRATALDEAAEALGIDLRIPLWAVVTTLHNGLYVDLFATEQEAWDEVADWCEQNWETMIEDDAIPDDREELIDEYLTVAGRHGERVEVVQTHALLKPSQVLR